MPKPCHTATVHDQAVGPVPDPPAPALPPAAPLPADPGAPPDPPARPSRRRPPAEEQAS